MTITRRMFIAGGAVSAAIAAGSTAHQLWLRSRPRPAATGLTKIPLVDLGGADLAAWAVASAAATRAIETACIGELTPAAALVLAGANRLARRWLAASGTPYLGEIDRIAAGTGVRGAHLLNSAYEWGCTALAAPSPDGRGARLLRTLDWPFHGLGRNVVCLRQPGAAGAFFHLSWPGAVGVLTGMAPGRFAAAINQPPVLRQAPFDLPTCDAILAGLDTWRGGGRLPALHLLRHVFETAPDFAAARAMLQSTPIAAPAIFTLVGVRPEETCVIEREREAFVTQTGVASAANIWRYSQFPGVWRGGRASEDANDSEARAAWIEKWADRADAPFAFVQPPVLNAYTRLAVEADPRAGVFRAMGYEEDEKAEDSAAPATTMFELDPRRVQG